MIFRIENLEIRFAQSTENVAFADFTYFYGKMGSGKSSIVKLIDYALGGDIELSPALQREFIGLQLYLKIGNTLLTLERQRDSNIAIATTEINGNATSFPVPYSPDGPILPGEAIESVSDLIFSLAGITPPLVRKSKLKENTTLQRLSFRNLFWYSYLDQDEIDSNFFHLDHNAHAFKKLASKDVLRQLIGYHNERIAELEQEIISKRSERLSFTNSADSLEDILLQTGIEDEETIIGKISDLKDLQKKQQTSLIRLKEQHPIFENHAIQQLKSELRYISTEIDSLNDSLANLEKTIAFDKEHVDELRVLIIKAQRDQSAKRILRGFHFTNCPSCHKPLPEQHSNVSCEICGQDDSQVASDSSATVELEKDAASRIKDIDISIKSRARRKVTLEGRLIEFNKKANSVLQEIEKQTADLDSSEVSMRIEIERHVSQLNMEIEYLEKMLAFPSKVSNLRENALKLTPIINSMNAEIAELREAAERDATKLRRLNELFLYCLTTAQIPGISDSDNVQIPPSTFLPEVYQAGMDELIFTSFSNISSGGKKTLFKCCFALAVHLLSKENGGILPEIIIIDSAMKNISERENPEQFNSFLGLVKSLSENELKGTQFIIIEKELFQNAATENSNSLIRHMMPDSDEFPPLIPYYRGH